MNAQLNPEAASNGAMVHNLADVVDELTDRMNRGEALDLDRYAGGDSQLRDKLERIASTLTLLRDSGSPGEDDATSSPMTGQLGDFRLLRELGRGGMGVVYEAEQISLNRRMAVKVLPFAAMLDKQQLKRFKNEARAAATLDHPHIVSLHSVGEERGVHYYAMQLVEGQSVAEVIAEMREVQPTPGKPIGLGLGARTLTFAGGRGGHNKSSGASQISQSAACPTSETRRDLQAVISTVPTFDTHAYFRAVAELGRQAAKALDCERDAICTITTWNGTASKREVRRGT